MGDEKRIVKNIRLIASSSENLKEKVAPEEIFRRFISPTVYLFDLCPALKRSGEGHFNHCRIYFGRRIQKNEHQTG